MKGTNPETQGHRWAKRVKKRLKKEQREEGSTPQPEPKPVAAKKIELSDAEVDRVINRYSERLSEVGRMNSKQRCTAA